MNFNIKEDFVIVKFVIIQYLQIRFTFFFTLNVIIFFQSAMTQSYKNIVLVMHCESSYLIFCNMG
jgi:hypothetical protein